MKDLKFHLSEAENRNKDLKHESSMLKEKLNNQLSIEDLSNQIQRLKLQSEHSEREKLQVNDENERLKEEISFVSITCRGSWGGSSFVVRIIYISPKDWFKKSLKGMKL